MLISEAWAQAAPAAAGGGADILIQMAPIVLIFVPPIHMYRQLRGAYGLGRLSAIWRTAVLILFAFVAAALFFVMLLALGVLG